MQCGHASLWVIHIAVERTQERLVRSGAATGHGDNLRTGLMALRLSEKRSRWGSNGCRETSSWIDGGIEC